jgi:hypothetical protein
MISLWIIHECRGGMWGMKHVVQTMYRYNLGEIDGHNDGSFAWTDFVQWGLGRWSNCHLEFEVR